MRWPILIITISHTCVILTQLYKFFTPRSHIPIVSPDNLLDDPVDEVIVFSFGYLPNQERAFRIPAPRWKNNLYDGLITMKALITGATGFLGSYLTELLVERGETVTALLREQSNPWRIRELLPFVSRIEGTYKILYALGRKSLNLRLKLSFIWHGMVLATVTAMIWGR